MFGLFSKSKTKFNFSICDEVKILAILKKNEYIVELYEVLISNSHPFMYLITEYCDLGTIMNKDKINFNYFHNVSLITHFKEKLISKNINKEILNFEIIVEEDDNTLVKKYSLSYSFKKELVKYIFTDILKGLAFIHSKRVGHRDIKLENMVFSSLNGDTVGRAKLIDFSISSIVISSDNLVNEPGGSVHFQGIMYILIIAPEQFEMDEGYNAFIADIWSAGICIYIFLSENFPFDADSEIELQTLISDNEIEYPEAFDKSTIEFLKLILNKNPEKRLSNIEEIISLLAGI